MPTKTSGYAAFLRGINVGGNRAIKNDDLAACLGELGLRDVRVVLASGNVVFSAPPGTAPKLRATVETGLQKRFDYPAKVVIVELAALQQIVDAYPFDVTVATRHHYVLFLTEDVAAALVLASEPDPAHEEIAAGERVVYWTVDKGSTLETPFAKRIARAPYKDVSTNRNINTLRKILALGPKAG